MLPGTLTTSGNREHVLWCTLRSSMNACTCMALQERIIRKAVAQPRCETLFPPNACCIVVPSVRLEVLDTEILVGCRARVQSSELFNCSCVFNHDDGMNQSLGDTIQGWPRLQTRLLWVNTTVCLSPLSVHSQLQSLKNKKPQTASLLFLWPQLHVNVNMFLNCSHIKRSHNKPILRFFFSTQTLVK